MSKQKLRSTIVPAKCKCKKACAELFLFVFMLLKCKKNFCRKNLYKFLSS